MIRRVLFAAIVAAGAVPQVAFADIVWPPPSQKEIETAPTVGSIGTIAVGEAFFVKIEGPKVDGAILDAPVTVRWSNFPNSFTREYAANSALFSVRTPKLMACATFEQLEGGSGPLCCFIDDDDDGRFDRTKIDPYDFLDGGDRLQTPIPYRRQRVWYKGPGAPPAMKTEFVYLGSNGTSLSIGSRTTFGATERPGQSFTIPLGPTFPQPFAVGEAVFTLSKVDGMGITVRRDK